MVIVLRESCPYAVRASLSINVFGDDIRSSTRAATAVAVAALLPVLVAPTAHAASEKIATPAMVTSCPNDGYIDGADVCTTLSNGILLLQRGSGGTYVNVEYNKSGGSTIRATLGYLRSGALHWGTTEYMSAGNVYDYSWSPSASCNPDTGEMYVSTTGSTYQTPPTTVC
jgi:hypothetical protein